MFAILLKHLEFLNIKNLSGKSESMYTYKELAMCQVLGYYWGLEMNRMSSLHFVKMCSIKTNWFSPSSPIGCE